MSGPAPYPQNVGAPYNSNGQYIQMQDGQNNYSQPPPQYGPNGGYGEKPTFDQAFKLDKPKWNDLWAGLLVWTISLSALLQTRCARSSR